MKKEYSFYHKLVFIAILLAVLCILGMNMLYQNAVRTIIDERDKQLVSLAYFVDHSLQQSLGNLPVSLYYKLRNPKQIKTEEELESLHLLYDTLIPESLNNSTLIYLYDPECGLLLQNDGSPPIWLHQNDKNLLDNNGDLLIVLQSTSSDHIMKENYSFSDPSMTKIKRRIVTLPLEMTSNGFFSIGISQNDTQLYQNIQQNRIILFAFMLMLLLSGIVTTHALVLYRQKIINVQRDLDSQMKERELLDAKIKEGELLKALMESQHQNSIHQLQPHFLYNSLSSIREIVMESPEYAADLLLNFTIYLRSCLKAFSEKDLIPFKQELQNTKAYVAIEMMRFGENKLTIEYDIQEKDFLIIPLGLQPLVENAIRHGIGKKRYKTGTVRVRTCWEDDCVCIIVEDDGVGFDVEKVRREVENGERDSTGLFNLKMRYKHKMHADMRVESEVGVGSRVCIRVPGGEVPSGDRPRRG